MKNPCKVKAVFSVEYHELNDYIAKCLGLDHFEGQDESPNDTSHEYSVSKEDLGVYEKQKLLKILTKKECSHWELNVVLDHMCSLGYLEPGNYVMRVSW